MKEFESIEEVAKILGDGGHFSPDTEFKTIGEGVDALINLGNTDKVYAQYDDHMSLKDDLSSNFLNAPLEDADNPKFASEKDNFLEHANNIIPLSERALSEEDIEEIQEDIMSRGGNPDDLDI